MGVVDTENYNLCIDNTTTYIHSFIVEVYSTVWTVGMGYTKRFDK